jgi:hypothetical protein
VYDRRVQSTHRVIELNKAKQESLQKRWQISQKNI